MSVVKRRAARLDLVEIADFLAIHSGKLQTGFQFLLAAEETFDFLVQMPLLGSPRRLRSSKLRNLRQWPVKGYADYLIFYRPLQNGIEVFRVLHAKRDIEDVFAVQA